MARETTPTSRRPAVATTLDRAITHVFGRFVARMTRETFKAIFILAAARLLAEVVRVLGSSDTITSDLGFSLEVVGAVGGFLSFTFGVAKSLYKEMKGK
jgi:hypothetical protein